MAEKAVKEEATCVYDIVVGGRLVIYVGMTDDPERRMREHKAKGFFPKSAKMRVFKWFDTRREANAAEGYRQRKLLPHTCRHFEVPEGCTPKTRLDFERRDKLAEEREAKYRKELEEYNRTHNWEEVSEKFQRDREKYNDSLIESYKKYEQQGMSFNDIAEGFCMTRKELKARLDEHDTKERK